MSGIMVGTDLVRAAVRMLQTGQGTKVVASAKKFVIPVPNLGNEGQSLVIPRGREDSFQPLRYGSGSPMRGRGLVLWNRFDSAWKAVVGNGKGALIVNEVPEEEAARLFRRLEGYENSGRLSHVELRDFIRYARRRGLVNIYGTQRTIIRRYFVPVDPARLVLRLSEHEYGWMRRDPSKHSLAIYIRGPFSFQDPSSTAQVMHDGGILMWHKGSSPWAIDPTLFMRTYELAGPSDARSIHNLEQQITTVG